MIRVKTSGLIGSLDITIDFSLVCSAQTDDTTISATVDIDNEEDPTRDFA